MASSQSNPAYNPYQNLVPYKPDWNFITQAMSMKQQRVDANKAQLQNLRNQVGAISLAKDEDQQYLDGRIKQLENFTNQFKDADISSSAVVSQLAGNFNEIFDESTQNAIVGTKILQNEQAEWADKRKNKPGEFSQENYEFAMRKASSWLNDKTVGTSYNGGGGFIEYRDVNAKLMKALPDLMKSFTEEEKRQVASGGSIGSIITVKSINKEKMSAAIESLLDEKDRKQLEINAWAQYDNLPEEVIREDYDSYINSNIELADDKQRILRAKIRNSTGAERQQYQAEYDFWDNEKDSLESRTYDNIAQTGGKEAAYNMLYTTRFKQGFLEAFTFNDYITDIDVDETAKANMDIKLEMQKMAEDRRHHMATENISKMKIIADQESKEKKEKKGDFEGSPIQKVAGQKAVVPESAKSAPSTLGTSIDIQARNSLVSSLQKQGLDEGAANNLLSNDSFIEYVRKGDFTKPFMNKGKTINVSHEKLQDYRDNFVVVPKAKKEAFSQVNKIVGDIQSSLLKGLNSGNIDDADIPVSKYGLEKQPDGRYKLVPSQGKGNRYRALLDLRKKGALNRDQKKELNLLTSLHLMTDPTLTPANRNIIRQKVLSEDLKDVKYDGYMKKLIKEVHSTDAETVPGFYTDKGRWRDTQISNFKKGDIYDTFSRKTPQEKEYVELDNEIKSAYQARWSMQNPGKAFLFEDNKLKPPKKKYSDSELQAMMAKRKSLKAETRVGLDDLIKDQFKIVDKTLEEYYNPPLPSSSTWSISKDDDKEYFTKTKNYLGFYQDTPIKFEQVFDEQKGIPTGQIRFYQEKQVQTTKDGKTSFTIVRTGENVVNSTEAKASLNIDANYSLGTRYDARSPRTAREINLGNGTSKSINKVVNFSTADEDKIAGLYNRAAGTGLESVYKMTDAALNNFQRGAYNIKLEVDPATKMYYAYAYKNGKVAFDGIGAPVKNKFERAEVTQQINNADNYSKEYFMQILDNYQGYYATNQYNNENE
jgi:ribosomal protein S8